MSSKENKMTATTPSKKRKAAVSDPVEMATPDVMRTPQTTKKEEKEDKVSPIDSNRKALSSYKLEPTNLTKKFHELAESSRLEKLDKLYGLIRTKTGSLGGGGSGGEIYGELTQGAFHKIVKMLEEKCNFTKDSVFIDIGSGLAKPNFHTAIYPGVKLSIGIEVQGSRWWQSINLLHDALGVDFLQDDCSRTILMHANIMEVKTLEPVTHVYAFNRGMPFHVMAQIATLFHASRTSEYLICFDSLNKLEEYGFKLKLLDSSISGVMHGSGEQHKCYIYQKTDTSKINRSSTSNNGIFFSGLNATWGKIEAPTEERYFACVPHSEGYQRGFLEMNKGVKKYREWVWTEVGFNRSKRNLRKRK